MNGSMTGKSAEFRNILIKGGSVLAASLNSLSKGGAKDAASATEMVARDIRIENGVITDVEKNLAAGPDETVVDATKHWVFPGFVDLHTHLRDFDQSGTEDIESGTRAAAAGGYTTVTAMANSVPVIDNALILHRLLQLIAEKAVVRVLPVAAVTMNLSGELLTNMYELAELGAMAFSDDGKPVTNLALLRRALQNAKIIDRLIISHPEDHDLSGGGCMNDSPHCARLGLGGIPFSSESACVAREIEVVRETKGRLHFAHISTEAAVKLIRRAKEDGLAVTADVTPHHLVLTDSAVGEFDTDAKMNPPLRSGRDRQALIDALLDGTIDAIATDHAPHPLSAKQRNFAEAPFGVIGLETAFPLLHDELVATGVLSLPALVGFLTEKPAAIVRLEAWLEKGRQADLTIINPKLSWKYNASTGFSKSSNSPFDRRNFSTKVAMTIVGGRIVHHSENIFFSDPSKKSSKTSTAR